MTLKVSGKPNPPFHHPIVQEEFVDSGQFEARFFSAEEAQQFVLSNTGFWQYFSKNDLIARMRIEGRSIEQYQSHFIKQLLTWSDAEKEKLDSILKVVKLQFEKFNIKLPKTINFIKTTGDEELEGTQGYCLKFTVVLSGCLTESLITHELFHIHSQASPVSRKRLYEIIQFNPCNHIQLPDEWKDKRMINPDSLFLDSYIEIEHNGQNKKVVPFDTYEPKTQKSIGEIVSMGMVQHKFIAIQKTPDGEWVYALDSEGKANVFDMNDCREAYLQKVGYNTHYTDSPEEILAENFVLMVWDRYSNSEEIIEKMNTIFNRTPNVDTNSKITLWQPFFEYHITQIMIDQAPSSLLNNGLLVIYELAASIENCVRLVLITLMASCRTMVRFSHALVRSNGGEKYYSLIRAEKQLPGFEDFIPTAYKAFGFFIASLITGTYGFVNPDKNFELHQYFQLVNP